MRKEAAGTDRPFYLEANLALTPDQSDTFVREVDENLRRDQVRDFAKDNAGLLIGAVILFLAVCGGLIFWHEYRGRKAQEQVEQLAQVYTSIDAGNTRTAPQQLDKLSDSSSKGVRASAMFGRAALAIQQGETKLALAKYREIAGDDGLPKSFRDLALIRQTALEFDSLPPQDVISRLEPLAKPGTPWFGSAGEMTAIALIKQGKKDQAGRVFGAMARDKSVPDAIRARSIQIASTLGVDASDAIPSARAQ
ncbi:hypothetical protein ACUXST_002149 [Sphingomonas sp. F9_3S_D5_B_2]